MAQHELPNMKMANYAVSTTNYTSDGVGHRWSLQEHRDEDFDRWGHRREMVPTPDRDDLERRVAAAKVRALQKPAPKADAVEEENRDMTAKRLVRVIIVDPHDDIPTEDAVLYMGTETFTDKTDQELFFDIPIGDMLKEHNERRVKVRDKKASKGKEREQFLEPARIRDLDMVVLTISEFGA